MMNCIRHGTRRSAEIVLYSSPTTVVKETLDAWPPLPIIIQVYGHEMWDMGNIITALEYNNRICELYLFDMKRS
jgi:hypothetical protein